ncbi:MAG: hypothetical protein J6J36_03370 [Clostridia bacterium]|nr:hypothetical protein [Clostridia bacterium]
MKIDENLLLDKLCQSVKRYIELAIKEYGSYMKPEQLELLNNLKESNDIVRFNNDKTVSFFCMNDYIKIPRYAVGILKKLKWIPGFGANKKHKCYKDGEILNNTTYLGYLKHVIIAGLNYEQFCEESLPHEVIHLCGSGGWDPFREGLTELKARMLSIKYNLPLSRCGYNKEVAIVSAVQDILGEDLMSKIAFTPNEFEVMSFVVDKYGADVFEKLVQIRSKMRVVCSYKNVHSNGILSPIKKILSYDKLDYSEVWPIIEELKQEVEKNQYKTDLKYDGIMDYIRSKEQTTEIEIEDNKENIKSQR